MRLEIIAALIFSFSGNSYAAEADQYTVPESEIRDITAELNSHANWLVGNALDGLNSEGGCGAGKKGLFAGKSDEERLYGALEKIFNIHGQSALVDDILDGRLQRTVILLDDSVYRDWDITSGIFLSRSQLTLSPNIKVGGLVIGVDKLEHMFGYGLKYLNRHYLSGMPMQKVLFLGAGAEKVYLGGNVMETGVFSYSDLAANFNGMRFWNSMLQKRDDILGKRYNQGPYIVCENGKWKRNPAKPIDISRYVDRTLQEHYNCSKFATAAGLEKFVSRLEKMALERGAEGPFACPVSQSALEEAAAKYRVPAGETTIDHWIINRKGSMAVSYTNEF